MPEPRWLDADEQRAWRAYLSASRLLFDELERELQHDAGIPHGYYEILVQLSESPDRTMRMSDLASRSLSSRSRLSHAVARLEEMGWVRRETCLTDKRGQLAVLTEAGFAKLEEAAKGHVGAVRCHLFDRLTPEQVIQMREIGEAIIRGLGHEGAEAALGLAPRLLTVDWSDDVDDVIGGDLTVAVAYVTPAGGAVVTAVAPVGLRDRAAGTVGFTTSLGFGKKLERIVREPRIALAYHAREHGHGRGSSFVLVQGRAAVDLEPDRTEMEAMVPQVERFLGPVKRGPVRDRLLREYYAERVVVTVDVDRVVAWPDLECHGSAAVAGADPPDPAPAQRPPGKGTGPRVDVARAAHRLGGLDHRLLGYRQADGYPTIVPVAVGIHGPDGIHVAAAPDLLPPGGRRAGLLGHSYRAHLVGLASRTCTGWLEVDSSTGAAVYSPHTEKGFVAPPNKTLLLVGNGIMAKVGLWQARRKGTAERLTQAGAGAGG